MSENFLAVQRRQERMKKYDIEFEIQLRHEKLRFERKKPVLELKMTKLEKASAASKKAWARVQNEGKNVRK